MSESIVCTNGLSGPKCLILLRIFGGETETGERSLGRMTGENTKNKRTKEQKIIKKEVALCLLLCYISKITTA